MLNDHDLKNLSEKLSFWNILTADEQKSIADCAFIKNYYKGDYLNNQERECLGLIVIESGQIRAFITSENGKEVSLFRLMDRDICIFSASCVIKNINFDIQIEVEKPSKVYVIPISCFNIIKESNIAVNNFALELISSRFSDVMWVFEQFVFGRAVARLANFLIDHMNLGDSNEIRVTHEFIANNLGTAREVITRLLKHLSTDGIVSLQRGVIKIENYDKLKKLC
ncbi:MAG: Crp/Fnr family transcriptional regulator [Bacillota bacterium]